MPNHDPAEAPTHDQEMGNATSRLIASYLRGRAAGQLDISGRTSLPDEPQSPQVAATDAPVAVLDLAGAEIVEALAEAGYREVLLSMDSAARAAAAGNLGEDVNQADASVTAGTPGPEVLRGAGLVILELPKSLSALDDAARAIAASAANDVQLVAGGRIKHMTRTQNDVLAEYFERVDVSPAQSKSRLLIASGIREPRPTEPVPKQARDEASGLVLAASGLVFGGTKADRGSRLLTDALARVLPELHRDLALTAADRPARLIDLGSGNGYLAAWLAREFPDATVLGTDDSAAAVAATRATFEANGLTGEVLHADALAGVADRSADLVVCNPPFHNGTAIDTTLGKRLFAAAARVLRPGGQLIIVSNSHLRYRLALEEIVGPVAQLARDAMFTVLRATKAADPTDEPKSDEPKPA